MVTLLAYAVVVVDAEEFRRLAESAVAEGTEDAAQAALDVHT